MLEHALPEKPIVNVYTSNVDYFTTEIDSSALGTSTPINCDSNSTVVVSTGSHNVSDESREESPKEKEETEEPVNFVRSSLSLQCTLQKRLAAAQSVQAVARG